MKQSDTPVIATLTAKNVDVIIWGTEGQVFKGMADS